MSTSINGSYQSFQITPVTQETNLHDLKQSITDNGKVDILFENDNQLQLLSGDKVNLNELNSKLPEIGKELQLFDRNQDGFLVENELKYNYAEAKQQAKTEAYQDIEAAGSFANKISMDSSESFLPAFTLPYAGAIGFFGIQLAVMKGANSPLNVKAGALGAAIGMGAVVGLNLLEAHLDAKRTAVKVLSDSYQEREINRNMETYKTPQWNNNSSLKTTR